MLNNTTIKKIHIYPVVEVIYILNFPNFTFSSCFFAIVQIKKFRMYTKRFHMKLFSFPQQIEKYCIKSTFAFNKKKLLFILYYFFVFVLFLFIFFKFLIIFKIVEKFHWGSGMFDVPRR